MNVPIHLNRAIETSRYLFDNLKQYAESVIKQNTFFAHNEHFLADIILTKAFPK